MAAKGGASESSKAEDAGRLVGEAGWPDQTLVCRDRRAKTLVFVEVKTRTTDAFGTPHTGVTRGQQDRIIHGAKEWLRLLNDPQVPYRFDVVEVLIRPTAKVHLIRGAFQVPDDIYW